MKIYFMKDVALETLKANLNEFLPYFAEDSNVSLINALKKTLQETDDRAIFEYSGYDVPDGIEQTLIDNYNALRNGKDGENVCVLFDALKDLPPTVACDERFWAGFTLLSCWNFVRKRWFYSEDFKPSGVKSHYLFGANTRRSFTRNALARLWWIGYLTYDEKRANSYELTKKVCEKADIITSLLERSFSNSRAVVVTTVETIIEVERNRSIPSQVERNLIREIMKYINMLGGVYVLETLPQQILTQKIKAKAEDFLGY